MNYDPEESQGRNWFHSKLKSKKLTRQVKGNVLKCGDQETIVGPKRFPYPVIFLIIPQNTYRQRWFGYRPGTHMPIPLIRTMPLAKESSPSKSKIIVRKQILGCGCTFAHWNIHSYDLSYSFWNMNSPRKSGFSWNWRLLLTFAFVLIYGLSNLVTISF